MMQIERQRMWGWIVAFYIFLAGVGGGTFLFSFILNITGIYEPVARMGALVGPLLVLFGTFFLLFDLGSVTQAYRMFTSPSTVLTSWMVRGAWILLVFIIFGLAYSLPSFELFEWLPWGSTSGLGKGIGIVAALLSVLVVIYPGFLLGVIESIPFWNTPILPPLFFVSGLDTGIAVLVLIGLAYPAYIEADSLHLSGAGDIILIFFLFILLGAYIEIVRQSGATALQSIRLLKTPLFIVGAILLGLLVPFGLLLYSIIVIDTSVLRALAGISSVLILSGGLFLRYSVIRAGVRISVR
jgi:formate-dependent nitrite reductase membrane component NrfD